ncbi:hypothetical protein [Paenibacillus odorifer]|uniref:hypothetical protein n=1 Tax=Paenibacillus odorifer TaxID=189426 RepID=UPI0015C31B7B|nr:hypothetical protein [Paenibacillus odorifer]
MKLSAEYPFTTRLPRKTFRQLRQAIGRIFRKCCRSTTYRVNDRTGKSYLLRIHEPFIEDMKGLQHTYSGILGELQMLEKLGSWSTNEIQTPVRNNEGELITIIEYEG